MIRYIKYELENVSPLRISNDATSQNGQTDSLKYIPGSTVRGMVMTELSRATDFDSVKAVLFSNHIRFLDAVPVKNGNRLLPAVKGFYEDKTEDTIKKLENVVISGDFSEGLKRASLGNFCDIEDMDNEKKVIHYYSVKTGSDMKIKINLENGEKQNVFRNEYVLPGVCFQGYIAMDDEINAELEKKVASCFSNQIVLGNGRSAGLGKMKLVSLTTGATLKDTAYAKFLPEGDVEKELYLLLLSHSVMRAENGDYCGLNFSVLENKLGVTNLKVQHCSTSVVNIRGYNRTLQIKLPSVPMYEMGSVFHLSFDGTISHDKLIQLVEEGIGVRRNEGFGEILFMKDYEKVQYKQRGEKEAKAKTNTELSRDDKMVLEQLARNYALRLLDQKAKEMILGLNRKSVSNSQIGNVEAVILANRYNYEEAKKGLEKYFDARMQRDESRKVHRAGGSIVSLKEQITEIMAANSLAEYLHLDKKEVMGFQIIDLLKKEDGRRKLDFILDMIRYENRGGNGNEQ